MWKGTTIQILLAPEARQPLIEVGEVRAVPGKGLEGDRYFKGVGTFSKPQPDREVTLIETEALEALARDYGIELEPREARRNVVTRGVPLNHLVGRKFRIGRVTLRGLGLCEPCSYLEGLAGKAVRKGLTHRGGLRAQILTEGVIRLGDAVAEI